MSKKLTEKVVDDRKLSKNTTSMCLWCFLAVWIMLQQSWENNSFSEATLESAGSIMAGLYCHELQWQTVELR